jgi:hypothetical protein
MSSVRSRLDIRSCIFQAPDLTLRLYGDLLQHAKKLVRTPSLPVAIRLSVPHLACLGRNCNWALP